MLDLRYVVDHLPEVQAALARRGREHVAALEQIVPLADQRRAAIRSEEDLARQLNEETAAMARIADKKSAQFDQARTRLRQLGDQRKQFEQQRAAVEAQIEQMLLRVPNAPAPEVPDGDSAEHNRVVRTWGEKPVIDKPLEHHVLGDDKHLGVFDFDRAGKLSGARFVVMWGAAARMERALTQFMLDLHTQKHGYTEVYTPFMVKDTALRGTGQLPKFEQDLFKINATGERAYDLYLIPTAEVPVTNLHADEILDDDSLPRKYVAFTPCFRAEAGAAGKDTHGLIRNHQFDKVELVRLERPEQSDEGVEELTRDAEAVLQALGLHYRVVLLCAGDMGANARKTYDIEVWLPGQDAYREISSCSTFGDYQARRAGIRYRPASEDKGGKVKPRLLHTLNGSALAVGRTLVAVFEQYQQADGSVIVPPALRPYMGGLERITKAT
jgi:seryl-tRNA synthetase